MPPKSQSTSKNSLGYREPIFDCTLPVHPIQRAKLDIFSFFKRTSSEDQCYLILKGIKNYHCFYWRDRFEDNYRDCNKESRARIYARCLNEIEMVSIELDKSIKSLTELGETKRTHCLPSKKKNLEKNCNQLSAAKNSLEKMIEALRTIDYQKDNTNRPQN